LVATLTAISSHLHGDWKMFLCMKERQGTCHRNVQLLLTFFYGSANYSKTEGQIIL
jgi:hypothetical protein